MKQPATEAERHELRRNGMYPSDVAVELNVSIKQVYQYIADGELAAWDSAKQGAKRRDYRITRADFEKFRKSRLVNADKSAA